MSPSVWEYAWIKSATHISRLFVAPTAVGSPAQPSEISGDTLGVRPATATSHCSLCRSCNASLEALYGTEEEEEEENNEEETLMASSPLSSKRLKVSDINITRYKILTPFWYCLN